MTNKEKYPNARISRNEGNGKYYIALGHNQEGQGICPNVDCRARY